MMHGQKNIKFWKLGMQVE